MKILFLTNLLPYPLDSGGSIHTYSIIKALHELGAEIDLLCFYEEEEKSKDGLIKYCNRIIQIPHRIITATNKNIMLIKCGLSLFTKLPFVVFKYKNRHMYNTIQKLITEKQYDVIYVDHLNLGVYLPLIKEMVKKPTTVILNEHNCEYKIMETNQRMEKANLKRLVLKLETGKLKRFEKKVITNVDMTTVLTEEDYMDLKEAVGGDFPHSIIPVGIPKSIRKTIDGNLADRSPIRLLFVGTLTWEPNNHGICWFLENVMSELNTGHSLELYIVGNKPSQKLKKLAVKFNNVYVKGFVENLEEYYEKCDFLIAPIFIGSGQKVKIVEAFSRGMPVISSEFAARGIPHEHKTNILIADTPEEYINVINIIKKEQISKKLSDNCYEVYVNNFSYEVVREHIARYIAEYCGLKE